MDEGGVCGGPEAWPKVWSGAPIRESFPVLRGVRGSIKVVPPPPLAVALLAAYRANGHLKSCRKRDRKSCRCAALLAAQVRRLAQEIDPR